MTDLAERAAVVLDRHSLGAGSMAGNMALLLALIERLEGELAIYARGESVADNEIEALRARWEKLRDLIAVEAGVAGEFADEERAGALQTVLGWMDKLGAWRAHDASDG